MAQRDTIKARRKKILAYLEEHGRADVSELARFVGSTDATVRRDLFYLENKKQLIRTHGGAVKHEQTKPIWQTSPIAGRLEKNKERKMSIGEFAATLIKDNESIMVDGGSTTQIFSSFLKNHHNLLVVTNSPGIAEILLNNETARIIQIGGELIRDTYQVAGTDAEKHLGHYYVDKCIISVSGADPQYGCYSAIPTEASIKRMMIEHSRESILLIDSSKFERKALCFTFPFSELDIVVTDSGISKHDAELIIQQGATLHIVDV
ncbi:MAG: DeoR/GlpR transcriptional regulator [Sphaerochaeta sp.]|jgi:DeoR/GlpR family transcriptional regulator of sugar metabolism|nr:DeoR/GlpR family DNA-binding transcription regulator [Spirochaetota bacterium]TAH57145.1 MAG: DeoR/GlpR transcriptional regulator [Sphaerochaeta sp.]HPY45886.1 DeoR/GlpR family DNA-binding transcription regulator [Sphaerochaeta sp.]HQB05475.1 DeoR/GlpR family DNA-binding transcription regulator [Sphaerochaeta sp.]